MSSQCFTYFQQTDFFRLFFIFIFFYLEPVDTSNLLQIQHEHDGVLILNLSAVKAGAHSLNLTKMWKMPLCTATVDNNPLMSVFKCIREHMSGLKIALRRGSWLVLRVNTDSVLSSSSHGSTFFRFFKGRFANLQSLTFEIIWCVSVRKNCHQFCCPHTHTHLCLHPAVLPEALIQKSWMNFVLDLWPFYILSILFQKDSVLKPFHASVWNWHSGS